MSHPASPLPFRHLYVHVPFCRHKCGYCDFNAYAGMDRLMGGYQVALERELERARAALPFGPLRTVYFGGGTPSLLPAELAGRMLAHVSASFQVEPCAEVTLEANPASVDPERLDTWRAGGVNRLSLGVQGFDRRALAVLERRTDGAQAERAFRQARDAGFENISLDLIYGVPFQTRASRHNRAYWECRPVYGAGAGAHSYATDGERAWRWWNVARPREYVAAAGAGAVEAGREELPPARARAERVMLGLRTTSGLEPPPGFASPLRSLEEAGLVVRRGRRYAPTRRGLDLHNRIALAVL